MKQISVLSETEAGEVLKGMVGKSDGFWTSDFVAAVGKTLHSALHTDGVECTLSVSQEVKMKFRYMRATH